MNAEETEKMKGYIARAKPGVEAGKFDGKLEMYQKFLQGDRSEQASRQASKQASKQFRVYASLTSFPRMYLARICRSRTSSEITEVLMRFAARNDRANNIAAQDYAQFLRSSKRDAVEEIRKSL